MKVQNLMAMYSTHYVYISTVSLTVMHTSVVVLAAIQPEIGHQHQSPFLNLKCLPVICLVLMLVSRDQLLILSMSVQLP